MVYSMAIDNGQATIKYGTNGRSEPQTLDNVVCKIGAFQRYSLGRPETPDYQIIGKKLPVPCQKESSINNGHVENWDYMTRMWKIIMPESSNTPCLLAQAPGTSKQQKAKSLEIMFEKFDVPAFYSANQSTLSLYASGKTTGLSVSSGMGCTYTVPTFQGYSLPQAIGKSEVSGKFLSHVMKELRQNANNCRISFQQGQSLKWQNHRKFETFKEQNCFVALDFNNPTSNLPKSYTLPDGNWFKITLFMPQSLFRPELTLSDACGIHQMSNISIIRSLLNNIVLSGGTTMLPGLPERLKKQMQILTPEKFQVEACSPEDRRFSAWIGGAILTQLSSFIPIWVTKGQYHEQGDSIAYRKCF